MFPNIAETEEVLFLQDLQVDTAADNFHLNYEEHLKPYIYETISEFDREIVESHVEICAECRGDLRDLLQFHEELEREKQIRKLSKPSWWQNLTEWFSVPNRKAVWLAFASVLVFISAGLIWFFIPRPANEIAENTSNLGNLPTNQAIIENQAVNEENRYSVLPNNRENKNINRENKTASPEPTEKEAEIANLVLPKFLDDLRTNQNETLRGNGGLPVQKIAFVAPNGMVIRENSPVLTWENNPNVQSFEVSVFDEFDNRLTKAENLTGNKWRVPNLAKGKLYKWQVTGKSISENGQELKYLGQGKFYIISQAAENRINAARNALERGRAFAEAGLLTEAAKEFRKYLKENPNSENAKKFLRQIEQAQL